MNTPDNVHDALLRRIEERERTNGDLHTQLRALGSLSRAAALVHEARGWKHAEEISSTTLRTETLQDSRISLQASGSRLRESEKKRWKITDKRRNAPGGRAKLRRVTMEALERGDRYAETELQVIWPEGSRHWPLLRLTARIALAVAKPFHELDTNAAKYVALSADAGRVAIECSALARESGQRLRIVWQELDGPPVTPPGRRGFGTRLVERSLAQELNGSVTIDFAPTGVVCMFDAPLAEN